MKDIEGTMIVENVGLYLPNIQHHFVYVGPCIVNRI